MAYRRFLGHIGRRTLSAGSTPPSDWVPTDITNLGWWRDPSQTGTITASSGLVTNLADLGPNGRNGTATGTQRPTTGTQTINGLNVLDYDGSANGLYVADFVHSLTDIAYFAVVQSDSTTADGSFDAIVSHYNTTSNQRSFMMWLRGGEHNKLSVIVSGDGTASATVTIDGTFTQNDPHVVGFIYTGGAIEIRIDGALAASSLVSGTLPGSLFNSTSRLATGNRDAEETGWDGKMGEEVFVDGTISPSELSNLEAYMLEKWLGIGGSGSAILQENGDALLTESGDTLIQE